MSYKGLHLDWIEDWSQFFRKCNWCTFRFALIEVENDVGMGGFEATIVFVGLGARIRYNYAETESAKEIMRLAKGVSDGCIPTEEWKP